jgi:23S rRNA (cytidine2498-2'-O)-methyltransferase
MQENSPPGYVSGAMAEHSVLFSVSEAYYRPAVTELRRVLPVRDVLPVGPDAGIVVLSRGDIRDVHAAVHANRLRFVRHLAAVLAAVPTGTLHGDDQQIVDFVRSLDAPLDTQVAVQVWESGKTTASPQAVRLGVTAALAERGIEAVRSGSAQVLSVCVGENVTAVALNGSSWALSDWPGGRLRLAHSPAQISRSEFKLEELFSLYDIESGGTGLDLGASPGGWTRILLRHNYHTVHAVDPADLAPVLVDDPGVIHHRTTAGEFLRNTRERFDIVVNDMKMVPELSAQVMVDAADRLNPGGYAIVTLKLDAPDAVNQVDRALKTFGTRYDVVFARQLQHNRHELTVVGRLPGRRRVPRSMDS